MTIPAKQKPKPASKTAPTGKAPPLADARVKGAHKRRNRSALSLIAGLLVAGGLIRIGAGIDKVMALEAAPPESATTAAGGTCAIDAGTGVLLAALQAREQKLTKNEQALSERRQALGIVEKRISERLEELKTAEQELSGTLALADKASETDLAKLTTVYENMKPKDAALLFSVMDPDFAAGFLARMRPDAAAGILAGLDPRTAYAVSAVLAGRNATVPKD